jgi:hypothetical protein
VNIESLGQRTKRLIRSAGISPRILAAVTKIHFTTIYAIIRDKSKAGNSNPLTVDILTKTLDSLDTLIADGKLPFKPETLHKERAEVLKSLIENI